MERRLWVLVEEVIDGGGYGLGELYWVFVEEVGNSGGKETGGILGGFLGVYSYNIGEIVS